MFPEIAVRPHRVRCSPDRMRADEMPGSEAAPDAPPTTAVTGTDAAGTDAVKSAPPL
ncbi:hypothetical protein GCM10027028_44680 [Streptomyces sundarbansensis]